MTRIVSEINHTALAVAAIGLTSTGPPAVISKCVINDTTTRKVRISTNPVYYEQTADNVELWSPGNPTFPP